jgi:hypothetical protein
MCFCQVRSCQALASCTVDKKSAQAATAHDRHGACLFPGAMSATVHTVSTGEQLRAAVERGAVHIELTQHLDLSELEPSELSPPDNPDMLRPSPRTRSITVRMLKPLSWLCLHVMLCHACRCLFTTIALFALRSARCLQRGIQRHAQCSLLSG